MRNFTEMIEEYYRAHPEEIDGFIETQFEEYAEDGDLGALLSALRTISRVKGVNATAEPTRSTRGELQKALFEDDNPQLESVDTILHAIGYRLTAQPAGR